MNSPVLIIRTVSVEKLSPVLDACRAQWPAHPLIVATNPGRENELRADARVSDVVPCPSGPDGFSAPITFDQKLIAVVVPVANAKGSGYANVMRACRKLRVESHALAFQGRRIRVIGGFNWRFRWRTEMTLEWLSRWIARVWARRLLKGTE